MQPEELRAFAQENRCTVLYKAHRTLIAAPDGRLFRNHTGNPGMAKGGSGDTLAGMLVSLIGQDSRRRTRPAPRHGCTARQATAPRTGTASTA